MHLLFLCIVLLIVAIFIQKSIGSFLILWILSFMGALLISYVDHETKNVQQLFHWDMLSISAIYSLFFTGLISLYIQLNSLWLRLAGWLIASIFIVLMFHLGTPRPIDIANFLVNILLIGTVLGLVQFASYGILKIVERIRNLSLP